MHFEMWVYNFKYNKKSPPLNGGLDIKNASTTRNANYNYIAIIYLSPNKTNVVEHKLTEFNFNDNITNNYSLVNE